jgi:uncharacterized protein
MDVVILTVDSLGNMTATEYADMYYDFYGYGRGTGQDGILLLVSMEQRDWAISTCGHGIRVFTDAGQKYMADRFVPLLSQGDYYDAFAAFANLCEDFLMQAAAGQPYDSHNLPGDAFNWGMYLIISLAVGMLIGWIVVSVMKAQLKSVRSKSGASNYVRDGSLCITNAYDFFLYSTVTRTPRPKANGSSTHRSSSGSRHGGSSGKF